MRIDIHTHSNHSDGTDSPSELIECAAQAGLDVVGLTDHDTFTGWPQAQKRAKELGIGLLRGVELTCKHERTPVHLLAYLPDPTNQPLATVMEQTRHSRTRRIKEMAKRLGRDYPITWEMVSAQAAPGATLGRPHLADALVACGAIEHRGVAFEKLLHPDSPYYVRSFTPEATDMLALVTAAGGVPVLAHPLATARGKTLTPQHVEQLAGHGLFALEAHHRDHSPQQVTQVEQLAARLGLEVTGSSDYHGAGKFNRLGENLTQPRVLRAIVERGAIELL